MDQSRGDFALGVVEVRQALKGLYGTQQRKEKEGVSFVGFFENRDALGRFYPRMTIHMLLFFPFTCSLGCPEGATQCDGIVMLDSSSKLRILGLVQVVDVEARLRKVVLL